MHVGADQLAGEGGQAVGRLVAGLVAVDNERPAFSDAQSGEPELGGAATQRVRVSEHLGAGSLSVGGQGVRHAHQATCHHLTERLARARSQWVRISGRYSGSLPLPQYCDIS